MSFWYLSQPLDLAIDSAAQARQALLLPGEKLADLSRAQDVGQIASWLRELMPEASPEHIGMRAAHFWRLSHELLAEDYLVLVYGANRCRIAEITGSYRLLVTSEGAFHSLPVRWLDTHLAQDALAMLKRNDRQDGLVEIADKASIDALRHALPASRRSKGAFLHWVALPMLLLELIYFWPR